MFWRLKRFFSCMLFDDEDDFFFHLRDFAAAGDAVVEPTVEGKMLF